MSEDADETTQRKRPARQFTLAAAAFLAILAVVLAGGWALDIITTNWRGEAARQRVLKRMRDHGAPIGKAALYEALPSFGGEEAEQAALEGGGLYYSAILLVRAISEERKEGLPLFNFQLEMPRPGVPVAPELTRRLTQVISAHPKLFARLAEAGERKAAAFPAFMDNSSGVNSVIRKDGVDLQTLHDLRELMRWLRLRSLERQAHHDAEGALAAVGELLRLAIAIGMEPADVGIQLVRNSAVAASTGALEQTLSRLRPEAERLARLLPLLARVEHRIDPLQVLRIQLATEAYRLQYPDLFLLTNLADSAERAADGAVAGDSGPPPHIGASGNIEGDVSFCVPDGQSQPRIDQRLREQIRERMLTHALRPGRLKLNLAERTETLLGIYLDLENEAHPEVALWADAALNKYGAGVQRMVGRGAQLAIGALANLRIAATAIRLERYHQSHGRWPATLESLPSVNRPAPSLIDPFTGDPLLFKRIEDGCIVYSVAENLTDDEGEWASSPPKLGIRRPDDRSFRLLDPARRNQLDPSADNENASDE